MVQCKDTLRAIVVSTLFFYEGIHRMITKIVVFIIFSIAFISAFKLTSIFLQKADTQVSMNQFEESKENLMIQHQLRSYLAPLPYVAIGFLFLFMFLGDLKKMVKYFGLIASVVMCLTLTGCWRPFEPIQLEVVEPNEEAFLLPYTDTVDKQAQTNSEEFLRKNLVHTQQVKIPQQWVPVGYEYLGANGAWRPAATLVKVDKSPVTREWTADTNSGTSTTNQAVWVMTSDQVEFSTGWTCTAYIASKDDAVKFLYYYRNGSLEKVMDTEIRAKIQSSFGLEVTDLSMTELRLKATPHILKVVEDVTTFFHERGITITNLGITGGFVYKDPSVIATMVKVFNAEQEKAIAMAGVAAQSETNKKIQLEAEAKAKSILTVQQAEADGIKLVADAKAYEITKANEDSVTYMALKKVELEKLKLEKWDGKFPLYFMGSGDNLSLLLQTPDMSDAK